MKAIKYILYTIYISFCLFIALLMFKYINENYIMKIWLSDKQEDYITCYGDKEKMKWVASEL